MPAHGLTFRVASHRLLHTIPRVNPQAGTRRLLKPKTPLKSPSSQYRVLALSYKTASRLTPSSRTTYATLAAALFVLYTISKSIPHQLERRDDDDGEQVNLVYERYKPIGESISNKKADEILHWDSESKAMLGGSNILRCDRVRVASNPDVEDTAILATGRDDDELKWIIAGVFDGHAGWQTSCALQVHLSDYLVRHIHAILPPDTGSFGDAHPRALDEAIKAAFLELDGDIMAEATAALSEPRLLNDALPALESAFAGSCALVSYYNSDTRLLKVACTGDSRAVLGRRNAAGEWEAIALSADQTGHNADEVARLQKEHPNELEMIRDGRLLGLAVTRAFGDSRWKWSRKLQEQYRDRFFGPRLREPLLTPPYLTAEPVITTTKIQPEDGDFLIMASDGLWDNMTSDQAVDLVGRWLNKNDVTREAPPPNLAITASADVLTPSTPPFRENPAGKRSYTKLGRIEEKDFTVKDANAAVHLARNALGGRDEDRLLGMLTAQPPHSRNLRDDITVQVIFFGNDSAIIDVENV